MPGRRAFILEPQNLDEQELAAALGSFDDLRADEVLTTQRRILDTFDWRLHHRGLMLEADRLEGRWRLTLRSAETGSEEARQLVGNVPRLIRDLPPGSLRSRLDPIIGVRALLERAEVGLHLRRYRRLNADEKTVTRLSVEHAYLGRNGQGDLDLGLRLRLDAVRGYDGPTAKLAQRLIDELDLVDRPDRLTRDALLAAGHHPDIHGTAGPVLLSPDEPADLALAQLFRVQVEAIVDNEPGVIADIDTECLHDFRVAVRRTRSLLKLAGRVFPSYMLDPHVRSFRAMGKATNALRDLDVYLLDFGDISDQVPESQRADLDPLHELLVEERAEEFERVAALLQGVDHRRALDDWQAFLTRVGDSAARRDVPPIGRVAAAAIDRSYRRLIKQGRSINQDSSAAEIHLLRKRGKDLRYNVESFAGLCDAADVATVTRQLKKLQDVLGAFQDGEVQVAAIERFAHLMDERRVGSPDALLTMGLLRARFQDEYDGARADVVRSFRTFDRPKAAKRMRRLTAGVVDR